MVKSRARKHNQYFLHELLSAPYQYCSYSAAKANINNFTQWMAVHFNHNYSAIIRVNAVAPGFFSTRQNHFPLADEKTGEPTPRAKQILGHTHERYGVPEDLLGTLYGWLPTHPPL